MRVIIENILLFLLPTAMYLGYVLLTRSHASAGDEQPDQRRIIDDGALLVAATLVYYGTTTPGGKPGAVYTPPHVKDGRIEPGTLK